MSEAGRELDLNKGVAWWIKMGNKVSALSGVYIIKPVLQSCWSNRVCTTGYIM